jgi:hypothetical protein
VILFAPGFLDAHIKRTAGVHQVQDFFGRARSDHYKMQNFFKSRSFLENRCKFSHIKIAAFVQHGEDKIRCMLLWHEIVEGFF